MIEETIKIQGLAFDINKRKKAIQTIANIDTESLLKLAELANDKQALKKFVENFEMLKQFI